MDFNKYFDHTLLKPEARGIDIINLCNEALQYNFAAVCVNSCYVSLAADTLKGSDVGIACVVGFPLGASALDIKEQETIYALSQGATEIDMVINIGLVKDNAIDQVQKEIASLANICHEKNALLKVILETCLLTDDEVCQVSVAAINAGADYIKTSTGFSTGGATLHHVALMKSATDGSIKIKASGGIRTLEDAENFIAAGASRLGCSASVAIMEEYLSRG